MSWHVFSNVILIVLTIFGGYKWIMFINHQLEKNDYKNLDEFVSKIYQDSKQNYLKFEVDIHYNISKKNDNIQDLMDMVTLRNEDDKEQDIENMENLKKSIFVSHVIYMIGFIYSKDKKLAERIYYIKTNFNYIWIYIKLRSKFFRLELTEQEKFYNFAK